MGSKLLHRAALFGAAGVFALGTALSPAGAQTAPAPSDSRTKAQSNTGTRNAPAARNNTDAAAQLGGQSVRNLVGKTVYNQEGQSIGTVSDFVVDARGAGDKKVTHAVVGVGGFLGLGKKDVAIPIDHMRLRGDRIEVSSNVTADQLKRMAEYDQGQYRSVVREDGTIRPERRSGDTSRSDRRSNTDTRPGTTR